MCSTAADYLTFCRALLNGGELGGVRLIGPKTLALMTSNHLPGGRDLPEMSRSLFSEATYNGIGFGLGFSVTMDPAKTLIPGSAGEYAWGGAATTSFWIDPGGRTDRDFHDPGAAVERLSGAARTAHHGLCRDHRQQSLRNRQLPHLQRFRSAGTGRSRGSKSLADFGRFSYACDRFGAARANASLCGTRVPKPSLPVRLALLVAGTMLPLIVFAVGWFSTTTNRTARTPRGACSKPCAAFAWCSMPRCSA